ncbi:MAG: GNAT family N-acetyltransferase [Candidatus Moranbacteria bacterium]|nr:GNAT family N-acetyltransferase [Candidatus Moranbacteria bacterium]
MIKPIKSKKFTLRPFRISDVGSIRKHANDKTVSRNLSSLPHPYTEKDARFWIGKQIELQRQKNPENIVFAIEIGNQVAGTIGLHKIKCGHKAELGFWLGREFWGGGIMTDAVKDVVNFGFKNLKLRRIYAGVFLSNKGSARVLEKNGFKLEGISKKEVKKDNKFIDAYIFAKVR